MIKDRCLIMPIDPDELKKVESMEELISMCDIIGVEDNEDMAIVFPSDTYQELYHGQLGSDPLFRKSCYTLAECPKKEVWYAPGGLYAM